MDFAIELIALGLDSLILISCIKNYFRKKSSINVIKGAPSMVIDEKLEGLVKSHPSQKIPYVIIRGMVESLSVAITSENNPSVEGVMQNLKVREHVKQRHSTGFWADSERTIHEFCRVVPFGLKSKKGLVEVTDPLRAECLELEVISNVFKQKQETLLDFFMGFVTGTRQKGTESTESMLRKHTILTGIGELVHDGENVKLQPPGDGKIYYLTHLSVAGLLRKLEISKRNYAIATLVCGTVGLFIVGFIANKYYKQRKMLRDKEKQLTEMERLRKSRRKMNRDVNDSMDNQLCVVCKVNPLEIILLPCGHVCLCEDCSEDINNLCPICRAEIEMKSVAFIM